MAEVEVKIEPKLFDDNKAGFNIDAEQVNFTGKVTSDTELLTNAQNFADAINELFTDGTEGGEWQPPDWWIPVPEPEPWEAYFLVCTNATTQFNVNFMSAAGSVDHRGEHIIDWGDGTIETAVLTALGQTHTYTNANQQYLIKITIVDTTIERFWCQPVNIDFGVLIIKCGDNFPLYYSGIGSLLSLKSITLSKNLLIYPYGANYKMFKMNSFRELRTIVLPTTSDVTGLDLSGCNILDTIKNTDKIKSIWDMSYCYGIKNLDVPNCANIGTVESIGSDGSVLNTIYNTSGVFNYCYNLNSINAPLCTNVIENAFQDCYELSSAVFADGCTYGTGAFNNCYSLNPKPNEIII